MSRTWRLDITRSLFSAVFSRNLFSCGYLASLSFKVYRRNCHIGFLAVVHFLHFLVSYRRFVYIMCVAVGFVRWVWLATVVLGLAPFLR